MLSQLLIATDIVNFFYFVMCCLYSTAQHIMENRKRTTETPRKAVKMK